MKYRADLANVLTGVTCTIEPGQHVGIVGRTGSGKSSLFTALYQLADELDGHIYIHGFY